MKQVPFVPVVREVSPEAAGRTPGLESAISYWTEDGCSVGEWLREASESRGAALAMRRGDEQLGFALYGPRQFLPRSERYLEPAPEGDEILLAYLGGDHRARRHLLTRVLRELRSRKVEEIQAVASDVRRSWHVPTRFLLESGWTPVRRVWSGGRPYTILRVDLKNTVEVGGFARGLIGRVRLPVLNRPNPAPGAFTRGVPNARRVTVAGSRS